MIYPASIRDYTFAVAADLPAGALAGEIADTVKDVEACRIVAVADISGERRVTYEVTYRSPARTLTGDDLDARSRVVSDIAATFAQSELARYIQTSFAR